MHIHSCSSGTAKLDGHMEVLFWDGHVTPFLLFVDIFYWSHTMTLRPNLHVQGFYTYIIFTGILPHTFSATGVNTTPPKLWPSLSVLISPWRESFRPEHFLGSHWPTSHIATGNGTLVIYGDESSASSEILETLMFIMHQQHHDATLLCKEYKHHHTDIHESAF